MKNIWKVKPIKFHFNLDTDRDRVPDFMDCRPFNPMKQHIFGRKKVEQMVEENPYFGEEDVKVVDTRRYKKHPVAVVETDIKFGGTWNPEDKLITMEKDYWESLSPEEQRIAMEHEVMERERAMPTYREYEEKRELDPHQRAVEAHHSDVWEEQERMHGEDTMKRLEEKSDMQELSPEEQRRLQEWQKRRMWGWSEDMMEG